MMSRPRAGSDVGFQIGGKQWRLGHFHMPNYHVRRPNHPRKSPRKGPVRQRDRSERRGAAAVTAGWLARWRRGESLCSTEHPVQSVSEATFRMPDIDAMINSPSRQNDQAQLRFARSLWGTMRVVRSRRGKRMRRGVACRASLVPGRVLA